MRGNRKLTGSALAQTLVFGWLEHPEASYQQLTETAVYTSFWQLFFSCPQWITFPLHIIKNLCTMSTDGRLPALPTQPRLLLLDTLEKLAQLLPAKCAEGSTPTSASTTFEKVFDQHNRAKRKAQTPSKTLLRLAETGCPTRAVVDCPTHPTSLFSRARY